MTPDPDDPQDPLAGMFASRGDAGGDEPFRSHDALQTHYGPAAEIGLRMHLDHLHPHYQAFVSRSPFVVIGTASASGLPSTSPKGDAPGFVRVDDAKTLLIPDRPGNNQIDSLHNLLENPLVSLIFFVPGVRETLRVKGQADISASKPLRARFEVNGKLPPAVVRVRVERAYLHCGKALIRSDLWNPEKFARPGEIPSIARMTLDMDHNKDLPGTLDEWEKNTEIVYRSTLY